jgi:hypothetical protein
MARGARAAVIITDADGRQVFGLSSDMYAELMARGTPPKLGEFTVRLVVENIPPWYVDMPGYLACAYLANRLYAARESIRQHRVRRAVRLMNQNRAYAETTSQGSSKPDGDSADA